MAIHANGPDMSFTCGAADLSYGEIVKIVDGLVVICNAEDDVAASHVVLKDVSAGEVAAVRDLRIAGTVIVKSGSALAVGEDVFVSATGLGTVTNPGGKIARFQALQAASAADEYIECYCYNASNNGSVEITVGAAALEKGEIAVLSSGLLVIADAADDGATLFIVESDAAISALASVKPLATSPSVVVKSGEAFAIGASLYVGASGTAVDTDPGSKQIRMIALAAATAADEYIEVVPFTVI